MIRTMFLSISLLLATACSSPETGMPKETIASVKSPETKAAAPPPASRVVTFPVETALTVLTTTTLSTKVQTAGEAFTATLGEPLVRGGFVAAGSGALVEGVVAEADKGGRVKGRARLALRLTGLRLADGRRVDLVTNSIAAEARATKSEDAQKIGIGGGIGAAIGAIADGGKGAAIGAAAGAGAGTAVVLLTQGEAAAFPAESRLQFRLIAPLSISLK